MPRVNREQRLGELAQTAADKLASIGINLPDRPDYEEPTLAADITSVDEKALMECFQTHTEWVGYMGTWLAAAEIAEAETEKELARTGAVALLGASEKTVAAAKAKRYQDPEYLELEEKKYEAYAFRKLLEKRVQAAESRLFIVSREVSRRSGIRGNAQHRNANLNT